MALPGSHYDQNDLSEIKPKWLRIGGYWYARRHWIDAWQTGKLPKACGSDQGRALIAGGVG
jgi:hypothetical protein